MLAGKFSVPLSALDARGSEEPRFAGRGPKEGVQLSLPDVPRIERLAAIESKKQMPKVAVGAETFRPILLRRAS